MNSQLRVSPDSVPEMFSWCHRKRKMEKELEPLALVAPSLHPFRRLSISGLLMALAYGIAALGTSGCGDLLQVP